MSVDVQDVVLKNLLHNEAYVRIVVPHLKDEYFVSSPQRTIFQIFRKLFDKYNKVPNVEAISLGVEDLGSVSQDEYDDISELLKGYSGQQDSPDVEWLVDETEKFCQERAIFNAISKSIGIMNGEDKNLDKGSIPELLSDALAVTFDSSIGHSYFEDVDGRFEFYHKKEERLPFNLQMFDKVTKGGIPKKTLTIYLGGTGTGKSLVMCHNAAAFLLQGYNVLYITMEMAEERIAERIDANLLNIDLDDLEAMNEVTYRSTVDNIKKKTTGNLIIKEYPTASAHVGHFRHLVRELKMKKNFTPDVIIIDYLNICTSSRVRGSNINSYTLVKSIAEELRGFAVECNVPIISATQTNRDGLNASDVDLTNTSESIGLPATADLFFALIATEDLQQRGQMMVKQLKNRFSDISQDNRFIIGVDKPKMRLYDVANQQSANAPVPSASSGGSKQNSFFIEDDKQIFGSGSKARKFDDFAV